ncbi:MAG TPA: bifunctional adenosylcobinamide kinase/adenosylcobinamide-phosphate guanylyltransferase [Pseudonocardia sp.]|nr:bifunctional adenosylcobinamide kinase/adenosylcobinamide-phosphate guanylyltransferase [Pseudonocardia sp.]
MLGGTRSGKSGYAEHLLPAREPVRYVATARHVAGDAEWTARIDAHRARRPAAWTTVEDADLPALLRAGGGPLLVDDIATWLTGVLDDAGAWDRGVDVSPQVDALVEAVRAAPGRVVLVSAEVGLGVVPATRAGRLFRDELGALNAALARVCDEVLLLVAGLPLRLK